MTDVKTFRRRLRGERIEARAQMRQHFWNRYGRAALLGNNISRRIAYTTRRDHFANIFRPRHRAIRRYYSEMRNRAHSLNSRRVQELPLPYELQNQVSTYLDSEPVRFPFLPSLKYE
jgi:hypothetical protein